MKICDNRATNYVEKIILINNHYFFRYYTLKILQFLTFFNNLLSIPKFLTRLLDDQMLLKNVFLIF